MELLFPNVWCSNTRFRTYYFYEFGRDEQHVALMAAVNSGKVCNYFFSVIECLFVKNIASTYQAFVPVMDIVSAYSPLVDQLNRILLKGPRTF